MDTRHRTRVAVLLATHNGGRFIEPQIRSLRENTTPFVLHWLDDHSTDHTREAVRNAAAESGIDLTEWHQPQHQGLPGAFFRLLECVEAEIYLFCDQDDIWQPGKIDATVGNLLPDLERPVMCFSDALTFNDSEPGILRRVSEVFGYARLPQALQESRLFMSACACGNTVGLTRPLRDIYLRHKDIARAYARMHDSWLYLIAVASGTARMLFDVPTTLYRRHAGNFTGAIFSPRGNRIAWMWRLQHRLRRGMSRHARGFVLAAATLPPGPKLESVLALARVFADIDRKQPAGVLARLVCQGAMWPKLTDTLWFAAACLYSDARE